MNICVLGSLNVDLMISTDRLPVKGETVHGNDGDYLLGGKGANQAVAASRMGIETNMIGCIGQDTFGDKILKYLSKEENLETSHIKRLNTFSGIATVFKLPSDNAIVVVPGANNLCDETVLTENQKLITNSDIFLTQLEIPLEIVSAGLKLAKSHGVITVLNPAPYQDLPEEVLTNTDYITPNDTEFAGLAGKEIHSKAELFTAMLEWQAKHSTRLIVTRGEDGVSYVENGEVVTVPAILTHAVDTTGAGDTFNGIFCYCLAKKMPLEEAIKTARLGASLAVRKVGAQTGMPTLAEIENWREGE